MTPPKRACTFVLVIGCLAAVDVSTASAAEPVRKVVGPQVLGLLAHPPESGQFEDERGWLLGDLLIRELVRQAVLIAARDELGLATRDEALRELIAADADAKIVDIVTQTRHGRSVWLRLNHNGKELWQHEQPCIVGPVNQYIDITEKMERLSRTEFVKAIRQLGLHAPPRSESSHRRVREEIVRKLAEVNLLSQYDALRLCHDQIRSEGESPERLAVLVRAYAHLGQLTQPFLSSMHRSFRARWLLNSGEDAPGADLG